MIADHLSLNVSYICRQFKKNTGKTITTYINEVKIDEAKRLIITTDQSIMDIATQLGYSSSNYFHRVFKDIEGITPKKYKEIH